jgi:cysteine-rich repeat protein
VSGGGSTGAEGGAPAGGEGGESTGANGGEGTTAGRGARGGASGRGAGGAASGRGGFSAGTSGSGGVLGGPVCGNGILEIGEGCDDGNSAPGDGCDAICGIESGFGCDGSSPTKCRRPYHSCSGTHGDECQGNDCCAGSSVEGGTFTQGQGWISGYSSTVSSFLLDDYEVTVARFRMFVGAYDFWRSYQNPEADSGANPNVASSGWKASWNGSLPADSVALRAALNCDPAYQTWADSGHDTLPINCVSWFVAFAFCIWDEGRLPTEAEWEYAAAGGTNAFTYPWGNTPVPTNEQDSTAAYANYDCLGDGSASGSCAFSDILPVGSKPAGRGFYGQHDLAGSLWEWTFDDYFAYPTSASSDYARVSDGSDRSVRGGAWSRDGATLAVSTRAIGARETADSLVGFRCARAP